MSDEEREELSDDSPEEEGVSADSGGTEEKEEPDPRHPGRDPLSGY